MVGAAPMTEEIQVQLRELMPQADMGQALGTTETGAYKEDFTFSIGI
jgi:hypothetical protein